MLGPSLMATVSCVLPFTPPRQSPRPKRNPTLQPARPPEARWSLRVLGGAWTSAAAARAGPRPWRPDTWAGRWMDASGSGVRCRAFARWGDPRSHPLGRRPSVPSECVLVSQLNSPMSCVDRWGRVGHVGRRMRGWFGMRWIQGGVLSSKGLILGSASEWITLVDAPPPSRSKSLHAFVSC